ncbi:hypothetical protein, partial [Altererythrobacter sp. C41]|uniref:hypothetical protein n=1 Tax=Altererythrobacter sp. C41 TaxID=2806021 RepID=UPI001931D874
RLQVTGRFQLSDSAALAGKLAAALALDLSGDDGGYVLSGGPASRLQVTGRFQLSDSAALAGKLAAALALDLSGDDGGYVLSGGPA